MTDAPRFTLSRNALLLLAVLVLACGLRLRGIAFGLPALYDPDEPIFVLAALKLLRNHTLNPGWFGHPGTTTIYALALIDIGVLCGGLLTGRFVDADAFARAIYSDPGTVFLPGRIFMLACGLLCIALTYLIGRRLFDPAVGLLAALLLALDPLHIKYSQIIRTDMHATVFVLLCLLASIGIARRGRLADFAWASLWLGLACATKWPAACVSVAIVGATVHRAIGWPDERAALFRRLALAPLFALATLIAASPFLLIDFATLVANLQGEARTHHPGATGSGVWLNLLWYLWHPLRAALGTPGLLLAAIGLGLAARRNRVFLAVILPVIVLFMIAISAQALIWERWAVPILPMLSIAAAVAIVTAVRRTLGSWRKVVGAGMAIATIVPLLIAGEAGASERANDTRAAASAWTRSHVARGSTIILEVMAFDMLDHGWRFLFPIGDAGCVDVAANLRAKIPYSRIERWRGGRPVIDLGTIAPATFGTCRADYAILADYDRYLMEPVTYAAELTIYRRLIAQGRIVATFSPVAGARGGPVIRIVQLRATPTDSVTNHGKPPA